MINIDNLLFQKLDLKGVRMLVKWAEDEGWNPGPFDADVYYNTDPNGFYGFFYEDTLIAGGAIISFNNEFGFMGLFIVKHEFRGKEIGRKLWYQRRNTLLKRIKEGASIGMDGVVTMQPFYEKGGFKIAFRDERYEKIGTEFTVDKNISPIYKDDFDSILEYDKQCFGFSRPQFLKPWIELPGNKTFKYVKSGKLKGFVIIRKTAKGYKVCPLFADNEIIAEELYKASLNSVVGEHLYLDIPVTNAKAVELIKKYNATYVFECARMYYGTPPVVEFDKIFGLTTFEVG
ncbi:MAG: GNAT family N-acetyltransferase [Bacteroidetes bacterium]|nr:GNAT family N-acetyltransferase [Bacteroidota bacterium]